MPTLLQSLPSPVFSGGAPVPTALVQVFASIPKDISEALFLIRMDAENSPNPIGASSLASEVIPIDCIIHNHLLNVEAVIKEWV